MTTAPAAVIFDLDGCLVDSESLSIGAIAQEIRDMGLAPLSFDDIRTRFLGVSMQQICQHVAAPGAQISETDFVDRVERRLFRLYREKLQQIDGVPMVLATLRNQGIAMAIATGGSIRRMRQTLTLGGLADWFEGAAFSADEVRHGKPAPDLFLFAAARLGVAPADCVVLEDSPHGVAGARAAGMRAVGFVGGSHLQGIRETHADLLRSKGAECVARDMAGVIAALLAPRPAPDGQAARS